ncbi:hypothetical protein D3C84_971150 [compost metagenome]
MKPSEALKGKTHEIRQVIESYGFVDARIFGSVCCGEDTEASDIDLLSTSCIEMAGKISLFDILDLESALEELLGVGVDFNIDNDTPEPQTSS